MIPLLDFELYNFYAFQMDFTDDRCQIAKNTSF